LSAVGELEKSIQIAEQQLAAAIQKKLGNIAKVAVSANAGRSNPYKALLDYELQDAPFFYGRSDAIKDMQEKMGRNRLTILHSESGSGKTSLMQAGLASRLLADGDFPLYLRPYQQSPAQFIKKAFLPDYATQSQLARFSDDEMTLRGFLERVTHYLGNRRLIIFLDQFEEFFTELSQKERQKFAGQLRECIESDLSVSWVLALRKEYFSDLRLFRALKPFENEYFLPTFNLEEAKEVVTEPAKLKDVDYEAGLVDRILEDLRQAEEHGQKVERISPAQMQLVCYTLFDELFKEDEPTQITHKFYEIPRGRQGAEKAGAKGILASHLTRVLDNELKGKERKIARHVLEMLVTSDVRRVVRSEVELHEALDGGQVESLHQILETLYDNRLIRRNMNSEDEPIYELTHDYLLTEIKLDPETQARKLAQEMLDYDVKIWQRNLPSKEILIAEDRFNIINDQRHALRLDVKSKELLNTSQQKIEEKRQRKLKEARKRTQTAIVVSVVMLLLFIFAGIQWNSATNEADKANSARIDADTQRELAVTRAGEAEAARIDADTQRELAVTRAGEAEAAEIDADRQRLIAESSLFAIQSQEYLESQNVIGSLLLAVEINERVQTLGNSFTALFGQDIVQTAFLSALSQSSNSEEGFFQTSFSTAPLTDQKIFIPVENTLWILSGLEPTTVSLPNENITLMSVSLDGNYLVFADEEGDIGVVETSSITETGEFIGVEYLFKLNLDYVPVAITINQDGTRLAVAYCVGDAPDGASVNTSDGFPDTFFVDQCEIQVWNLDSPDSNWSPYFNFQDLGRVTSLAFLANDLDLIWSTENEPSLLFVGSLQGQIHDLDQVRHLERITTPQNQIRHIAYLPDQNTTATGLLFTADEHSLQWWRVRSDENGYLSPSITPLGSPLFTEFTEFLMAVQPTANLPAIITANSNGERTNFTWYNAETSKWPEIACQLAGRNLNADEWQETFPTYEFDEVFGEGMYINTCPEHYNLHISFAENKLNEAEAEIKQCDFTFKTAIGLFDLAEIYAAATYGTESEQSLVEEEDFSSWGVNVLLKHLLENEKADFTQCFASIELVYSEERENQVVLANYEEQLETFIHNVQSIDEEIRALTNDADILTHLQYVERKIDPTKVAPLVSELQILLDDALSEQYKTLCLDGSGESGACAEFAARTDQIIAIGEPALIETKEQQIWLLNLEAGDVVSITMDMNTNTTFSSLEVRDENGKYIVGSYGGKQLHIPTLARAGNYFISTASDDATGYILTVAERSTRELPTDQTTSANIEDNVLWAFNADAGDIMSATLALPDDHQGYKLTLLNSQGAEVRYADGYEGNSAYIDMPITQAGTYFLTATSYDDIPNAYSLTVHTENILQHITIDGNSGFAEEAKIWQFDGEAGTPISIIMTPNNDAVSPVFDVYDSEGQYLSTGYSNGYGIPAQTGVFILPKTGLYSIYARDDNGLSGSYSLAIQMAGAKEIGTEPEYSTTIDDPLWYFTGNTGDRITIDLMESEEALFDPYLTLIGPDGEVLISDDGSGEGPANWDARISDFELVSDGIYYIVAGRPSAEIYILILQINP